MKLAERLHSTRVSLSAVRRLLKAAPMAFPGAKTSIATLLAARAQQTPQATAIIFEGRRYCWREVDETVNRWVRELHARGLRQGDVVALVMDNRAEYLFAETAIVRLGAVVSFINSHLSGDALAHAIAVCKSSALVIGTEHRERVEALRSSLTGISPEHWLFVAEGEDYAAPDTLDAAIRAQSAAPLSTPAAAEPNDTACYIYTSGTTGLPKAAVITHRRWTLASGGFAFGLEDNGASDVIYCTLPLYHSSGQFAGWGSALCSGAALLLRRRFSTREFWKDVHEYGATVFIYIGELCRYLLNAPPSRQERGHKLRVAVGNGLRETIWREFQNRFDIPLVREFYGATESNVALLNFEGKAGYVGKLGPGQAVIACDPDSGEPVRDEKGRCRKVTVGETGLIIGFISPVTRFDGYLDKGATNKKILENVFFRGDRWFNTGDLMRLDEGNWVAFADRAGDNYRWKGENISAGEVEASLHGCAGLVESIVYGVAVPGSEGRAGMAALVTSDEFTMASFTKWVRERVPSYQQPRFVRLLGDAAKTTGTFKYQKAAYRAEGFDPSRVADALFVRGDGHYLPLDTARFAEIAARQRHVD
jgi:fatty-acyl-CoA synthase